MNFLIRKTVCFHGYVRLLEDTICVLLLLPFDIKKRSGAVFSTAPMIRGFVWRIILVLLIEILYCYMAMYTWLWNMYRSYWKIILDILLPFADTGVHGYVTWMICSWDRKTHKALDLLKSMPQRQVVPNLNLGWAKTGVFWFFFGGRLKGGWYKFHEYIGYKFLSNMFLCWWYL